MTIDQIVSKAKYIQFPYCNESYRPRFGAVNPVKLPIIPDTEVLYTGMARSNSHHYTTNYCYSYVMPLIADLLEFSFSMDDFTLVPAYNAQYDLSWLRPKADEMFQITSFDTDETFTGKYEILLHPTFIDEPYYRELYRYPHQCSRVINLSSTSDRKLMISGDSQMIPTIGPLAHYFKEVWYFDNRTGYTVHADGTCEFNKSKFKSFAYTYADVEFTDVLMDCYCRKLTWLQYWNLQ